MMTDLERSLIRHEDMRLTMYRDTTDPGSHFKILIIFMKMSIFPASAEFIVGNGSPQSRHIHYEIKILSYAIDGPKATSR